MYNASQVVLVALLTPSCVPQTPTHTPIHSLHSPLAGQLGRGRPCGVPALRQRGLPLRRSQGLCAVRRGLLYDIVAGWLKSSLQCEGGKHRVGQLWMDGWTPHDRFRRHHPERLPAYPRHLPCPICSAEGGCTGEYSRRDLQHVRCYACGKRGHLSCAAAPEQPAKLSCHNCGQNGHTAGGACWQVHVGRGADVMAAGSGSSTAADARQHLPAGLARPGLPPALPTCPLQWSAPVSCRK